MDIPNCFERCCRLCAKEQEVTILIFSAEAKEMLLQKKLIKYLLIEIDEDDKLPKNICLTCCSKLQSACEFIDTAHKAQETLLNLCMKSELIELNNQEIIEIKTESKIELKEENNINMIEVSVDPMIVLQNSQEELSVCDNNENEQSNELEDVTYLHAVDADDVTIKLIKRNVISDEDNTYDLKSDQTKPFSCKICRRSFCTELALKNHSWIHKNERPLQFDCSQCATQCDSKASLLVHLKKHRNPRICQICGRIFRSEKNLACHTANHMSSKISHTCKICGRTYDTKSNLKNHSISHSNERPYKCLICKKGFKRNQDLKFHINQHTGYRPYKCPFCDKSFASSGNCYTHKTRMHPGWRTDGKARRRPVSENQVQIKTTTVQKISYPNIKSPIKYHCQECGHSFMKRDNYMYHMYKHTGVKPFQCSFCSEEFVTRRGLYLHHEKEHPTENRPLGLVSKNALLN